MEFFFKVINQISPNYNIYQHFQVKYQVAALLDRF